MSTQATKGAGTELQVGDGASPEVFSAIAEVTNISGPSEETEQVEVTHLSSTSKEYITGLPDGGTIELELNFLPADTTQQQLAADVRAGTLRNYKVVWSDPLTSEASFAAIVKKFGPVTAAPNNALKAPCTLKVSGDITWPS